jgi:hypothetical protein
MGETSLDAAPSNGLHSSKERKNNMHHHQFIWNTMYVSNTGVLYPKLYVRSTNVQNKILIGHNLLYQECMKTPSMIY